MYRKQTKQNIELLNLDLAQEQWVDVLSVSDVNVAYDQFQKRLLYYYHKNIPFVKIKTVKMAKKTRITKGISCNQTNKKLLLKTVNELLGKIPTESNNSFLINEQQTTDPIKISKAFNEYFVDVGPNLAANIDSGGMNYTDYLNFPCKQVLDLTPTDDHEIIHVVKELNSTKSSGHDCVSAHLLKQIICNIVTPLRYIFNLSLSTGVCPNSLKIAKVIPIHKKDDASVISNYRSISVLPSISKILEKIMFKRLNIFLENNNLLIPNQFGFRKGHSTEHAILHVKDKIIDAFVKSEHIIGVFMDLSKAFDTIDHKILIHKLQYYGVGDQALFWFTNYLQDRQQYVSFQNHESKKLTIKCGVPQGSILAPLLFIIYINDIVKSSSLLNFVIFADDINVCYSHANSVTLKRHLNCELLEISKWFKSNKLSLNVSKTNFIYFKKSNVHDKRICDVKIDGLPLIEKQYVKYLGVTIDSHLNFDEHIRDLHTSISRNIVKLYRLRKILPERSMIILYKSLILSRLSYCNIVWGDCSIANIDSLFLLQKRAIGMITNSSYLSHMEPLFHRLKILKIHDVHIFQTSIFMYKYYQEQLPFLFNNIYSLNSNHRTYHSRRSLRHHGPDVWNNLPNSVRRRPSLYSFKGSLKKNLIWKYQYN